MPDDSSQASFEHGGANTFGWARNAQGAMVYVDEVARGLACRCTCADCGAVVIARQGDQRIHHFAHKADIDCAGETALHQAAKACLVEAARDNRHLSLPDGSSPGLEHVDLEVRIGPGCIADALVRLPGRVLAVEIAVTHRKGRRERDAYRQVGRDAVEIDLSSHSRYPDRETLTRAVLEQAGRIWLCNRTLPHPRAHGRLDPTPPRTLPPAFVFEPGRADYSRDEPWHVIDTVVRYLSTWDGRDDPSIRWPLLRAEGLERLDSTPQEWQAGTARPQLCALSEDGQYRLCDPQAPIYHLGGVVCTDRGRARVDVRLGLNQDVVPNAPAKATLCIECPPSVRDPAWPGELWITWVGVDAWIDALEDALWAVRG